MSGENEVKKDPWIALQQVADADENIRLCGCKCLI
jgi:hypothetical protein